MMIRFNARNRITLWALTFVLFASAGILRLRPGYGQIVTASLSGSVTDPAGAAVPEASIAVTNTRTGISARILSDSSGNYIFPALNPGDYSIAAEKAGFKSTVVSGITLLVNQQARVDVQLQVGAVTTTVEVSGAAPLVQTTTASVGTVIGQREVVELPLNLRRFSALATLVPGTVPDNNGFASGAFGSTFSEQTYAANGNRDASNNPLLDGMDGRQISLGAFALQPPPDAIQEFKIQTNIYSAAFGKSAGSTINLVTKSGTNDFHGGVYEFLRNDKLDARNFFATNQADPSTGAELPGTARPEYRRNQFGFNAGGPIRKNKTFIFGYYEGLREIKGLSLLSLVPTNAEKNGDLSSFLTGQTTNLCAASGSAAPANLNFDQGQLFDPATESLFTCPQNPATPTVAPPTILVGTPIPGNMITTVDPVAQKFLPYYPEPNRPGAPNFVNQTPRVRNDNQFGVRLDHTIGSKDQLFFRYLFGQSFIKDTTLGFTSIPGFGDTIKFRGQNAVVGWTHSFGPRLLNEARIGFQRDFNKAHCEKCPRANGFAEGFGVTNLQALPGDETFPFFGFVNFAGVGDATYRPVSTPDMIEKYQDNLTWTHGRHTVVVGADVQRWQVLKIGAPFSQAGRFSFNGQYSSLGGELPDVSGVSDLADGLLGYPNSAGLSKTFSWAYFVGGSYLNYYAQDDFRISPDLSVNLGLRWEYRGRPREKRNILGSLIPLGPKFSGPGNATEVTALPDAQNDALCTNPANSWLLTSDARCLIASAALRNQVGLGGGNRESLLLAYYRDFAPRLGLAWRPMHSDKFVIRSGYGIFYDTPNLLSAYPASAPVFAASGFYNTSFGTPPPLTQGQNTTTGNVFLAAGIPPLSTQFLSTNIPPNSQPPRIQQWSFGIDTQLAQNWALEVDYVGNEGSHLALIHNVGNQPKPGVGDLQPRRPYPDFNLTSYSSFDANSNYNSLQAKLTKRFSDGLSFLTSYTFGHTIDDSEGNEGFNGGVGNGSSQDDNNPQADRSRGYNDARQRLVFSYIWRLPVGAGKRYLNQGRVINGILGGWEMTGVLAFQSGFPLSVLSPQDFSNSGSSNARPDRICNGAGQKTVSNWFDTSCFTTSLLATALANGNPRFGNSGRNILDGPGYQNWDFGLFKNFKLSERFELQFRSEFYNAFNHANFGYPNMVIGTSTVGQISSAKDPRDIQFGLKLSF